jgi:ATP-dependent exoDNAse (exonuclease V) beta subunit
MARDQIHDNLDATIFVEAGAGTGKTSALVDRIVQLVASGRTVANRLAAITFTEAAGAELRDRVLVAIERAAADPARPETERERCTAALRVLDAAAIETLHSFAARILSTYPLEAGLPPGFEVIDATRAAAAFEQRWTGQVEAMLENPALREPLQRALMMGLTIGDLGTTAKALHEDWDRLEAEAAELPSLQGSPIDVAPVAAELAALCAERKHCADQTDKLYVRLEQLAVFAQQLASAASDELESLRLLARCPSLRVGRVGRAGNWTGSTLAEVRGALGDLGERCDALLEAAKAATIPPLYASLRRFVLNDAEERRRNGQLEFHDLLVRARDLLRGDSSVRRALRERFSHLLIDEFQDTDPLQTEIAFLLAADHGDNPPPWRTAAVDAGRLFFVGDPKQSIYGFRRADIELYQAVQDRFATETEQLTQNFRSVPAITDWVNGMVEPLMGAEPQTGQATYVPLHAHRPAHPDDVTVRLFGEPRDAKVAEVRHEEATEIARVVRETKDGHWQVLDQRDDDGREHFRDAQFQDIAILVPTRTSLPGLLVALEDASIPYRLESRSLVYEMQEVRDLLAILRAIDDPTNEIALVAALRSPGFGCGDDDLVSYVDAGGRWDYRRPPPNSLPADHPVVVGLAWLRSGYEQRWWQPVSTTIDRVIRDRRLFELATADRRPREQWQRLRFVLDQARAFMDAGGSTLREFLAWTERQADEGARAIETVVPDADDDAVRIMTVHASKGLQFPIVLLTGLNVPPQHGAGPVLWNDDGRPELRLRKDFETAGYEALRSHNQELQQFEDVRLFYVAATRARDHLIVSLFHPTKGQAAGSRAAELYTLAQQPAVALSAEAARTPDTAHERAVWFERREQAVAQHRALRTISATALAKASATTADPNLEKEPPVEEDAPWRRGRAGTAIGRAVHSVLQTIDLATGEGLPETARAQAAAEGVANRASEIEQLARAALGSDVVRAAVASDRYWREVYVGVPIEGVLVEGFIDLLYETPDGYVVVDYKTDALPGDGAIDDAMQRYRPQGAAYALALSEALDRSATRCVFVFLTPGGLVEREIADLPEAILDVRSRVLAIGPPSP